jgi:hypothetical protein
MPTYRAKRISRNNNILFPDRIVIEGTRITVHRGPFNTKVIDRYNIASVTLDEDILFFADVIIESTGGQRIVANGFSKSDAREILNLLTS